jgi:hypothetical protein
VAAAGEGEAASGGGSRGAAEPQRELGGGGCLFALLSLFLGGGWLGFLARLKREL